MEVKVVENHMEYEDALEVRKKVFIVEQQVPEDLEIDEFEDTSIHFVAYDQGQAVGAGRLRKKGDDAKVERICVIPERRGQHIGGLIMRAVEAEAEKMGCEGLLLNAQCHALPFYEKLGYIVTSDEFEEAGISHVEMRKNLNTAQ
ncbi:GNAT family N-acetyltransferase [Camelliibacillus cellulosilyticus]|uniref:GNAT family N-acetyltransferase n=1 Tax=Camelliibacillus cellulosilyticus TaxID=2174486 RepID=A0ABV9GQ69_9BACL